MQHLSLSSYLAHPLVVGANGANGEGDFRDMMLNVDCRYRMADEVVPWALTGTVAGVMLGTWRGSIVDRKARQVKSSKRRKQREQSKRRRKGATNGRRLVGTPVSTERRRTGDFKINYPMHQGAMWGLIAGTAAGLSRAIWRFTSGARPMGEAACRAKAMKKLKADPSGSWGLLGAMAGAFMYISQQGSREALRAGEGEIDYLLIYTLAGGGGAWALSKWFS